MSEWKKMKISDLADISKKSINPQNSNQILFANFSLPAFDDNKSPELVSGAEILSSKFLIEKQMILFNKLNIRFKRIWFINELMENYVNVCSTEFIPLKAKKSDSIFLFYLLQQDNLTMKLIGSGSGTSNSHQRISPDDLMNLEVYCPAEEKEQQSIGRVFKNLDDKIENCNKIIANLNAQIEAIFKNWFIDFAPFADNLSEEGIPTGWRNSNVFDESGEVSERNKDDIESPVLSVVKDGEFVLSEDRFTKQVYSKKQTKYKIVSRNQIGFNPARANIGSIAMLTDFDIGLVSPIYIVFKLKNSILPTYFYYYMKRPVFLQNIQAQAIGTTRQNLSYDAFKLFPIVVPTEKAQKNFIDLITPMEQEIANQKKQIEKLANTRNTLLPKLMSGEIEVPVEEKL